MKKKEESSLLFLAAVIGFGLLLSYGVIKLVNENIALKAAAPATTVPSVKENTTLPPQVQPTKVFEAASSLPIKVGPVESGVIIIDDSNSTTMDLAFTEESVQQVMLDLKRISDKLSRNDTIYLVMNSPGGRVDAGFKLISFCKGLPQKVKTITIFSASMAFNTVQQLGERLILENGILMSHPASFGVQGSTPYQVASRFGWIMDMLNQMNQLAANRMGLTLKDYESLIMHEYWVYDSNAVKENAADKKVLVRCGTYAKPTKKREIETFFGKIKFEVASCPLIPGILSLETPEDATPEAKEYVNKMLTRRTEFTREYIVTNKFMEFQK